LELLVLPKPVMCLADGFSLCCIKKQHVITSPLFMD
jgi:hypothetical protein